jgi:hypothetical protein
MAPHVYATGAAILAEAALVIFVLDSDALVDLAAEHLVPLGVDHAVSGNKASG